MDFTSSEAFALSLAFLVPGFVYVQTREALVPSPRRDFSKSAVEFGAYSAINYLVLVPLLADVVLGFDAARIDWRLALLAVVVTVLLPGTVAILVFRASRLGVLELLAGIRVRKFPEPTAWDRFFGTREEPCWILVRLRNGEALAGIYDKGSFASQYPEPPTLYLKRAHRFKDGRIGVPVPGTAGYLIDGADIHIIEFWDIQEPST